MALLPHNALARARACIRIETAALTETAKSLGVEFIDTAKAVEAVNAAGGKLIFSGVGDPMLKRFGLKVVAFTGTADSDLARTADYRLLFRVPREACPLELAPTASTTAALALGDALAMVLLESRGLTRDDFAKYHPAGNLGRVLLLRVRDIMRTADRLPVALDSVTTQDAILAMTKAKSGSIALVAKKSGRLTGILTDGDFRRSALTGPDFLQKPVSTFMTRTPKTIRDDALGVDALRLFEAFKIDDLIVVDAKGKPVGLIDGQDLPKLKIV
jgi:arabinose-5-phosphate isomerase